MVGVNVIMGAGMDSLVVDVVEVNVIMGAGMHSLVSDFAVNNSDLAVVEVFWACVEIVQGALSSRSLELSGFIAEAETTGGSKQQMAPVHTVL